MLKPLPLKSISFPDSFFSGRINMAIDIAIPYMWETLNDRVPGVDLSGCIHNFKAAAGREEGGFIGCVFQDSDLWKWVEGASYSLCIRPDPALEEKLDSAIELAAAAQQSDGYLDTCYILNGLDKRFTDLREHHEFYVAGHMFEAAVAHFEATGKRTLLDVACRFADCIDRTFGPEDDKLHGFPGHEEIELGLARLYSVTGEARYLALADYFLTVRGQKPYYFDAEAKKRGDFKQNFDHRGNPDQWTTYAYYQADVPPREQTVARGHAVRQGYLLAGMAEVGGYRNDPTLTDAAERVFRNIIERQMYITGGVGSTHTGEAYSFDHDLPNDFCYNETCASIALIMTAARLNRLHPSGVYGDIVEKCLYNGILSGVSLDGKSYFYMNPLEVWPEKADRRQGMKIDSVRKGWFGCACCPPNLLRTLTGLGSYLYTLSPDTLYVDQYVTTSVRTDDLSLDVESGLPFDGNVTVRVHSLSGRKLAFRRPSWCKDIVFRKNGEVTCGTCTSGYTVFDDISDGDKFEIDLTMEVRFMRTNLYVPDNAGRRAVMRGPLVYCLEETDNGKYLWNLAIAEKKATVSYDKDLLGGVTVIDVPGVRTGVTGELYQEADDTETPVTLRFVPYYAWNNRGKGELSVWIRSK